MHNTGGERPRWFAILVWGSRRYAALIVAAAFGVAVALPLLMVTKPLYEAETLVVARQLVTNASALPRYGEAIFASDAMARRLEANSDLGDSTERVLAEQLELVAAEDSIVLAVIGYSENPTTAAQLADLAAASFVIELNRGGIGVGSFAVLSAAKVPTEATSQGPSTLLGAGVGLAAGALLGLGFVALVAAVRRPVLQPSDAMSEVNRPVLGVVSIPRSRRGHPDPHRLPGLVPVTRALLPLLEGRVMLVSARAASQVRQRLLVLLALTLAPFRIISVNGPAALHTAVEDRLAGRTVGPAPRADGPELELVDGVLPVDSLTAPDRAMSVVLVLRYGGPVADVRKLAANYLEEEILGAVIVRERGGLFWRRSLTREVASPKEPEPRTEAVAAVQPPVATYAAPSKAAALVVPNEARPRG